MESEVFIGLVLMGVAIVITILALVTKHAEDRADRSPMPADERLARVLANHEGGSWGDHLEQARQHINNP